MPDVGRMGLDTVSLMRKLLREGREKRWKARRDEMQQGPNDLHCTIGRVLRQRERRFVQRLTRCARLTLGKQPSGEVSERHGEKPGIGADEVDDKVRKSPGSVFRL